MLTLFTHSKRISGFDMAPPPSAMLAGGATVTGTFALLCFTNFLNLDCFLFFFFFVGPSMERSYRIAWCYLGKLYSVII